MTALPPHSLAHSSVSGLNLDLRALQREFGSPQFIVSESRLLENLSHFIRLTGTANRVFFPVKANPALAVLQILARNGVGADCASAHEVYLATLVGIPFERILYTTPATDLDYALRLLRAGASVVIDHVADLLELDTLLRPLNEALPGKILLRLNPNFSIRYDQTADYQEMTAHAAVSSKFGIPSEDLLEVMAQVQLRISGLHLHVGTQIDTLKPFLDALAHLHALAKQLRAVGHPIELLDLGGGLGIPFGKEDRFPTLSEFVSALVPHQRPDTYRYAVEPGHALIGNAVSLLLTLEKIKASRGKRWGVTNVGTDSLAKVTLLRWQHRVFHAQGELPWQGPDVLAGPLCFAGDVLLHETALDGLQVGDPLLVTTVGAYCGALSNRFNGRLAPGVLIYTRDGRVVIAHTPENPLLDPNLQSFQWGGLNTPAAHASETESPDLASDFYRLGSSYLWHLAAADQYKITEVRRSQPDIYDLKILTRSAVSFVSAPFALRLVGDAAIMSVLHSLGEKEKTAPVWGKTIFLECREPIASGQVLTCHLELSPVHQAPGSEKRKLWVRFDLADGKFRGHLEMIV